MEEIAYLLLNNLNDVGRCEEILQRHHSQRSTSVGYQLIQSQSLLDYFLSRASENMFCRLFHLSRKTLAKVVSEIQETKNYRLSTICGREDKEVMNFVSLSVLYINTCFSVQCCSYFSGETVKVVEEYLGLFNKILNELKDKIIRFPALNYQNLLKVNTKRFFPGAVGVVDYVVDCVFIPKRFSAESNPTCFSDSHGKQGIKLMVVVGRDGKIFNVHINENGGQSNCRTYLDSALGFTLRYHKRSVLNRGSFLLADRSFPELPYLQIPFASADIQKAANPSALSSYNYWHHKARFISQKAIQRWFSRCPKCRTGLPYTSTHSSVLFTISALVLHQLCQMLGDEWIEEDENIQCVVVASEDGRDYPEVDKECYQVYEATEVGDGAGDYYDLASLSISTREGNVNTYEKLKIVARKRRDFLVDLVDQFPNRTVTIADD